MKINNWLDAAKEHEEVFRQILEIAGIKCSRLIAISQAFKLFTEGDRMNKITILEFSEQANGVFLFSAERKSGPLAGNGFTAIYVKYATGKVSQLRTQKRWMY